MVNGSLKTPKPKLELPPELMGGRIGHGWYEDTILDSRIANEYTPESDYKLEKEYG